MTKKYRTFVILFSLLTFCAATHLFGDDTSKWVVGAERFKYVSPASEDPAVANGIAEMFPNRILAQLNEDLVHIVYPDEKREQALYDLRKTRLSLFLQLSAEYKKRDSLMLNAYSKRKLASKIKQEEKTIKEIQDKIAANLKEADEVMQKSVHEELLVQRGLFNENENAGNAENLKRMVRNMFNRDADLVTSRNIAFYKDDPIAIFEPSEEAKKYGYSSYEYERDVVTAGINTLLTGTITNYGQYFFVSVEVYEFPGGKLNQAVSEVGLIDNADMISTSISHQLIKTISNGLPVDLEIAIEPLYLKDQVRIYLDDDLQPPKMTNIKTLSGVHAIRFVCDGYREMGTSYFFEGNRKYKIEVTMQSETELFIDAVNLAPFPGRFYAAGVPAQKLPSSEDDVFEQAKIRIDDTQILGQFITEDGYSTNYYIPANLFNNSTVAIKSNNYDINDYIDKRRRIMYGSYTLFIISMIPYFYTYGNYYNAANAYNAGVGSYEDALTWQTRNQICGGVAIGCGSLCIFELIRYLKAVNSVLPQKAKPVTASELKKKKQKELKKLEKQNKTKQKEEK
ncbi:MAG: hypothetical protein K6C98_02975 [Treponema sp.]|nr:hypothetical protein [Treponema sp.]